MSYTFFQRELTQVALEWGKTNGKRAIIKHQTWYKKL